MVGGSAGTASVAGTARHQPAATARQRWCALLLGFAVAACGHDPGTPTGGTTPPRAAGSVAAPSVTTELVEVGRVQVGANPWTPVEVGGELWVPVDGDGTVVVVDAATRSRLDTIELREVPPNPDCEPSDGTAPAPETPVVADGLVWVPDRQRDVVYVIEPEQRAVVAVLCTGRNPITPAVAADALWVPGRDDASVTRVDRRTRAVTRFQVGTGDGGHLAVATDGAHGVWVITGQPPALHRFDPGAQRFDVVTPLVDPTGLSVAGGVVWVVEASSVLVRHDPATRVSEAVPVGAGPSTPVASADRVWVANSADGTVQRIDPATGQVSTPVTVGGAPIPPAALPGGGVLVVSRGDDQAVTLLGPTGQVLARLGLAATADVPLIVGDRIWVSLVSEGVVIELAQDVAVGS